MCGGCGPGVHPRGQPAYDSTVSEELPSAYPTAWETHAVLADGAPVELRPIKPSDRQALDDFHCRQSPTSIYYRFFQHRPRLSPAELDRFTQVDYVERMAFVALLGNQLVAVARYEPVSGSDRSEVAFIVDDDHHRRGLATLLLEYLAAAARALGRGGFQATVLAENHGMLRVFRRAGFDLATRFADGVIEVELDISLTPETSEAIADRQSRARSASVARLLRPQHVAVIGASRRPGSVGHELFKQILAGGFTGELYAVNPAAEEILGRPVWPSLSAIEAKVDLAVVAVPAAAVEAIVADAAEAAASGLLIVSSDFAERSPEGEERQRRLVSLALDNGMRLIGPNAFGMVNTAPDVSLRALFLPLEPQPGPVAVVSQSGPLGGALLEHLTQSGVGVSSFVALGNRADVSVNDLLDYWRTDSETEAILLYVENVGNLRTFARTARTVAASKPIVTLRPTSEHLSELLAQSGVIMVNAVAELAEVARLIAEQPSPAGRRVAVVSNAASVARLAANACRRFGLDVVAPSSVEQPLAPERANGAVLVDDIDAISLAGGLQPSDYEEILVAAAVSEEVDALLVAMVPTLDLSYERLRRLIDVVDRSIAKPVLATGLVGPDNISVPGVPTFAFPEEAARTLGLVAAHSEWCRANADHQWTEPDQQLTTTGRRVADMVAGGDQLEITLWSPQATEVMDVLDLPVPPWVVSSEVDELVSGAERLGYPVVLKARGARNRAIGEAGGVAIDLHDAEQLRSAFRRMAASSSVDLLPAAVQKMVNGVGNLKLELIQDPALGAFITVGPGGAAAAQLPPSARRFVPVNPGATEHLLQRLDGVPALDVESRRVVAAIVARLSDLAIVAPELARVTINPLLVAGQATAVGDLEVVIRPWHRDPLSEVRRL